MASIRPFAGTAGTDDCVPRGRHATAYFDRLSLHSALLPQSVEPYLIKLSNGLSGKMRESVNAVRRVSNTYSGETAKR